MTYDEAKTKAREWTAGIDTDTESEGWRPVMLSLLQRITILETTNKNLHDHCNHLRHENSCLSLDLGIKDQAFILTPPKDPT